MRTRISPGPESGSARPQLTNARRVRAELQPASDMALESLLSASGLMSRRPKLPALIWITVGQIWRGPQTNWLGQHRAADTCDHYRPLADIDRSACMRFQHDGAADHDRGSSSAGSNPVQLRLWSMYGRIVLKRQMELVPDAIEDAEAHGQTEPEHPGEIPPRSVPLSKSPDCR
jgi:hypothetical protein